MSLSLSIKVWESGSPAMPSTSILIRVAVLAEPLEPPAFAVGVSVITSFESYEWFAIGSSLDVLTGSTLSQWCRRDSGFGQIDVVAPEMREASQFAKLSFQPSSPLLLR